MRQVPTRLAGRLETADRWLDVRNPYDGSLVARVPALRAEHVDRACAAGAAAFARNDFPRHERAGVLDRAATLLGERTEEFAWTIVHEAGTPLRYARAEASHAVDVLRLSAAEARRASGEVPPVDATEATAGRLGFEVRLPLGVVGASVRQTPPLALAAHRVGPAVAAGCPVVLAPSALTPLSAVHLVDLLVEAGLPVDWVSVLTGDDTIATALSGHPVPRLLVVDGEPTRAPVVVEPDADLDLLVNLLRANAFSPLSPSMPILVQENRHGELTCSLRRMTKELTCGDPAGADTEVVSPAVVTGPSDGASNKPEDPESPGGPVMTVTPYPAFDAAVELANGYASGGYASVFTASLPTAVRALRALRFRGVLLNELPPLDVAAVDRALRDMTELRFLSLGGGSGFGGRELSA